MSLIRVDIRNLTTDMKNITVVGLVIAKSEPKLFNSFQNGDFRGVLTWTIRDSSATVNCVLWGSGSFIENCSKIYPIGSVVSLSVVRVGMLINDKFFPLTSSPFLITISEGKTLISLFEGDKTYLESLINTPSKPISVALTLKDLKGNTNSCGELIDVLVLIRQLKDIREIKLKNGKTKNLREVIVMDQTSQGVLLTLWNQDLIDRSEFWQPFNTVLFLSDVKIDFSPFYKSVCLVLSPKTIVTENPKHRRVQELLEFSRSINFEEELLSMPTDHNLPRSDSITTIMSIGSILDRLGAAGDSNDCNGDFITGVVYAIVTRFDLDDLKKIVVPKCAFCKKVISDGQCMDSVCANLQFQTTEENDQVFDIRLNLSDHSGTIANCRLSNSEAEKVLGSSAQEFCQLSSNRRNAIKWKYLMERCKIKMAIKRRSICQKYNVIAIVDMEVADDLEVANNITVY